MMPVDPHFAAARMTQIELLIPRLEDEMKPLKNYSRSFSSRVGSGGQDVMVAQYEVFQADIARLEREFFELGGVKYSHDK